jgi:aminopeptidase N
VVYTDFADVDVDSALVACDKALRFYTKLFKTNPSNNYIKFLVVPSRGGGISRKNFIAYTARRFNENFKTAIGHEMGHFWWNKAPTFSWEDWLNEGFAEFSMLWYIKCHFDKHVFDCYLEACRENARHACPIYEVDRDAPEAYDALYNKGALLLYDLEQKVGEQRFFEFMQGVAEREITSTTLLLDYAEEVFGKEIRKWIENRIKS